jgi:hypothetical protein
VNEIWWLEQAEKNWAIIDQMANGAHYTTRWAVFQTVAPYRGWEDLQPVKVRCFERLRTDDDALVRAEAEYRYQELEFERRLPQLSGPERKLQRKEINRSRPEVIFEDIAIWFVNFLSANHMVTYSVSDLERSIATDMEQCIRDRQDYSSRLKNGRPNP